MKTIIPLILFSFFSTFTLSQVGINTSNPDDGSVLQIDSTTGAFVPPRMTTTQMNAIPTPLEGAMVYNTTTNAYYVFKNNNWTPQSNRTLIVNREFPTNNNAILTPNNTYVDFPIGNANTISNNTDLYNVTANGTISINQAGNYLFTASLSSPNMPNGNTKYILALFINNTLVGYLNRGVATLQSTDYWGTSGAIMYPVNANDVIKIRYVINNNGTTIDAKFANIGVTKLD
ncbi:MULTISPECIES: hypothetical protein [Mesoflavibacter]|uniref:C1q domain-containing protein n=1 Tax=Mesoflavibacter profundi TaxID=2708110 RepID=A0ABT4S3F4_9FLAO|nr:MULTISPECIES: hypothetical protein [Mesoflavibacter]MDA0178593.1 hypothetical protein [Mesoflavibacter profundi]QIJ89532.1 hypothetical protein C7H62_1723 [Mesoflavibacter sp. HG96]QIJ92260.1 hypothetical protein C7H56_1723 [Mesoflavibacter sp. HG37]